MATEDIRRIHSRVEALRNKHRDRDYRAAQVRAVRHGKFDQVAPDLFSDEWPAPIVANRIDTFAMHASAALSPMPIITCNSVTAASDASRDFADKRSKIANHYLKRSRVQAQMQKGADQFYTYGILVTSVEPDFDEKFPNILIEDAVGFYPVWDRLGRTVEMARVFNRTVIELMAEFPELNGPLKARFGHGGLISEDRQVEIIKYVSRDRIVMYVADAHDLVLVDTPNPVGKCTYVATLKPGLDDEIRGAFDDLIWVQLALHAMQTYTLSATAQAVNAPFAAPNDVTEIAIGPGEVIRSNSPDQIRRIPLDVPQGAWAAQEYLANELEYGAIVPEALGGSIDASVVTGKGVQQLMAGYSQQIANAQSSLVGHWEQVLALAFEMDEKFWPDDTKQIEGNTKGTPYRLHYRPSRDIRGDYTAEVQYGGVAGLDPNRGLVFLLQALGGELVSKDYVRRHLPSDMNPAEEEAKITVEQMRGSLVQGMSALVQSIPQMVAAGQDPSDVIAKTVAAVKDLQKGRKLEDILAELFPVPAPQPQQGMPGAEGGGNFGPGQDDAGAGLTSAGMPPGLKPGLATEGVGARPPMEMLFAGVNGNGSANLQAGISRMNPARTV